MLINTQIKILRKPEVLKRTGYSKSTLHSRINEQLFVPAISLGGKRSVGWICHEVDAILLAMIHGKSREEIIKTVQMLVAQRTENIAGNNDEQ